MVKETLTEPIKESFGVATMHLHTKPTKDYLSSGDLLSAVIRASADIEQILFDKLYFERDISIGLISEFTGLGKYVKWALGLKLIEHKWTSMLNEFTRLRNCMVHQRVFVNRINADPKKIQKVNDLVLKACRFIEQNPVRITFDNEKQDRYNKYSQKQEKRFFS